MTNIVLTSRNRFKLLEQTLVSLYTSTDQENFNLTIVDDGSDDFRVRSFLHFFLHSKPNLALVELHGSNHILSSLKSIGVEVSRQLFGEEDYLYFTDNDVYFRPGWLDALRTQAHDTFLKGFRLWGGQNHPYHQPIGDVPGGHEYQALAGTSWLMDWVTWNDFKLHYKSDGPGVCRGEDTNFCQALHAAGHKIAALDPPYVIDCGWTNSEGKPSPGIELRNTYPGIYHE